jgi:hypothetical protein
MSVREKHAHGLFKEAPELVLAGIICSGSSAEAWLLWVMRKLRAGW